MADINTNQHGVWHEFFVEAEVEKVVANLGVDLTENVCRNREVELFGSLECNALGNHVVLVARVFDSLVLVLTCEEENSDLRLTHVALVLFKLLLEIVYFLEAFEFNPLRLLNDHPKADRCLLHCLENVVGHIIRALIINKEPSL